MIRLLTFCALLLLATTVDAQGWIKNIGGAATDFGSAATQTQDGGFAVAGISESFGTKTFDMLLTRTDFEGKVLWNKTYGGNFFDQCFDVCNSKDGGFALAGYTDPDGSKTNNQFYVVKTDANGNEIWARKFGNAYDDKVNAIINTQLGSYVGVGNSFNGTDYDAYIFLLSENGQTQWAFPLGGAGDQEAKDVIEVADGYVFVGSTKTMDVSGKVDKNVMMVKITKTGQPLWLRTYGDIDLDEGNGLAQTKDNGFIICGRTKKNIDILAIRTDSDGNEMWIKSFGGKYEDETFSVVATDNGDFVLVGIQASDSLNVDGYMLRLDSGGNKIWSQNIGKNPYYESFNHIIATKDGGFLMTGTSGDLVNDIYVVKTNDKGVVAANFIKGKVFFDKTSNCKFDTGETPLSDWLIQVSSKKNKYIGYTKANGEFVIPCDTGDYKVELLLQNSYWKKVCQTSSDVAFEKMGDTVAVDFPVRAAVNCANLEVNVSTPTLTRCASNQFNVSFCNRGTVAATNAYIIITFDEFFDNININLANVQALGNNTFKCNFPTIAAGLCGKFTMLATLDPNCNSTVLGQAHTVKAHIYPDTICTSPNAVWDGSSIQLKGKCQTTAQNKDKVIFTVENIGKSASTPKNGLIIEDDLVYKTVNNNNGFFNVKALQPNESVDFEIDANGKTFRMIVDQSIGHPGSSYPTVAVEGCGTNTSGSFSTGYVLQFNEDDGNPFVSICARESSGVANKNEKTGFPKGYKTERFISDSTDLDYQISFKNTFGKKVEKIVILDTLSNSLNVNTLREIISSHNYVLSFPAPNVLQFTFDNIQLPDSATNTLLSSGFIKFKISQKKLIDQPNGTIIYNRAAIHYDIFQPILTNRVKHTVAKNFIKIVNIKEAAFSHVDVRIYPNPFVNETNMEVEGEDFETLHLEVYDILGQKVRQVDFSQNSLIFQRENLNAGMYVFKIMSKKQVVKTGRMMIQ